MSIDKTALQAVATEMRQHRVNHGRHTSPTLEQWAERIEAAIGVSLKTPRKADVSFSERLDCFACGGSGCFHDATRLFFPERIEKDEYGTVSHSRLPIRDWPKWALKEIYPDFGKPPMCRVCGAVTVATPGATCGAPNCLPF